MDINQAIQEVINLTHSEIGKSGVALKLNSLAAPPYMGDRVQLQQVILNLVMNGYRSYEYCHGSAGGDADSILSVRIR